MYDGVEDEYGIFRLSPTMINLFLGLTEMSLSSMKGTPARMSTSRSFTTSPLNSNDRSSRVKTTCVSPTTSSGVVPSAWKATWVLGSIGQLMALATDPRNRLVSAPVSTVMVSGL